MKETIVCQRCNLPKPREEFLKGPKSRRRKKFCLECQALYDKEYQDNYRKEHRLELRVKNRERYRSLHGVSGRKMTGGTDEGK